jgi:tetratricopeptide (TPR) repeat protein/HAMP domain-containing protein
MSIRFKIFLILGISQILLLFALTLTFGILIANVKNEPQNQRAIELARNFQRELGHKDEKLKLLISELKSNPKTYSILQKGMANRSILVKNLDFLREIMERYELSIFELGDKNGKVHFRVHRPSDFGDDKSNQPLIQEALLSKMNASLETGHSGLGFRVAAPLDNLGTILIGQVVDSEFLESISGKQSVHLSVFEKDTHLISSSNLLSDFWKNYNPISTNSNFRLTWNKIPYYFVYEKLPNSHISSLDLNFRVLIDERDLDIASQKVWFSFGLVAVLIFSAIFIASFLFSRDIVDAVKKLNIAMKNIDLSKEDDLPLNRRDEIGQMGSVFQEMKKDLFQHQNRLEHLVAQKTTELQHSLAEIQTIKEQQDGDYFLTSLLIKPLTGVKANSKNIDIETLVRQKKNFSFRNKASEIGGDLCVVQEIQLKNKNYVVFLNADAMGKSIQGAGGALVMGTVFKSVITRTQQILSMQDRHPERWLKDCFLELQDVFVSFDGTMLLSAVIGLIDDETGTLYFINAEHPWVVLYRDDRASFLENNDFLLRKIGFLDSDVSMNEFFIHVFPMNPGDQIFVGSDGRDDILMGEDKQGQRIINEDETEFLKSVEIGNGNLERIEENILSKGELTDDFSLIRIEYNPINHINLTTEDYLVNSYSEFIKEGIAYFRDGNLENSILSFEKALQEKDDHPYILRELSKLYIKTKQLDKAIPLSERYTNLRPFDTDFLYYIALAYKQSKSYDFSIDYSERLRLRDPNNIRNLILLTESYMHIGNFTKADQLLNHIQKLDPENSKAERLIHFLEEKSITAV